MTEERQLTEKAGGGAAMTTESDGITYSAIKPLLPDGWEIEVDTEGGQPNGLGEIEESGYREWFTAERETHHRTVITLYGPWTDGPTEEGRRAQERAEQDRTRKADGERAEYERLRAIYEPSDQSLNERAEEQR